VQRVVGASVRSYRAWHINQRALPPLLLTGPIETSCCMCMLASAATTNIPCHPYMNCTGLTKPTRFAHTAFGPKPWLTVFPRLMQQLHCADCSVTHLRYTKVSLHSLTGTAILKGYHVTCEQSSNAPNVVATYAALL
jgi:hypothetical protein